MIACQVVLPSRPLPLVAYSLTQPQSLVPGMWMWGALFLAVAAYEAMALILGWLTLSQTTQRAPRWFKWSLALGLVALMIHLFRPTEGHSES